MSVVNKYNKFKNDKVGSRQDYQALYKYKNERRKQRHTYKHDNRQRFIDNVKEDSKLSTAHLNAKISLAKEKNKLKIVNTITNLHTGIIVLFSIVSAGLSCYGVTQKVNSFGVQVCILILTLILIIGNNVALQPKLIASLKFNQSLDNIIGTTLVGIASMSVFTVSIITNRITLDKLNIQDKFLPLAFTFGFDVAVLGLNFLQYSSAMFDVKDKVKNDLNVSSDITNNTSGDITKRLEEYNRAKKYITNLIKNTKEGEQIKYDKHEMKFCSSYFYKILNQHKMVEKKGNKYFKRKKVV